MYCIVITVIPLDGEHKPDNTSMYYEEAVPTVKDIVQARFTPFSAFDTTLSMHHPPAGQSTSQSGAVEGCIVVYDSFVVVDVHGVHKNMFRSLLHHPRSFWPCCCPSLAATNPSKESHPRSQQNLGSLQLQWHPL